MPTNQMSTSIVTLALGTNLGDRPGNLQAAIKALPPNVTVLEQSFVYETLPWGLTDQPRFLNMVIKGETRQKPQELLKRLKSLETQLGRIPSIRYGPRKIDIDILFYDDLILATPELTLPHPHLHERAFAGLPVRVVGHNPDRRLMRRGINARSVQHRHQFRQLRLVG